MEVGKDGLSVMSSWHRGEKGCYATNVDLDNELFKEIPKELK